ncbi:MAG: flagellar export protein FliJ [Peptococcaceae bacterium]|nr:flagellar export protein FliJ [Peptococcaceae bacterium]
MRKFSFRLEPVLEYRSKKEERAAMEQARAQKEYRDQRFILETIRRELAAVRESGTERPTAEECLARSLYIDYLTAAQARQEKVVAKASQNLEKRRREVVEARKDKLVLKKLKEKLYGKYMDEMNRLETKITDDQCMALSSRRGRG